jgi:hypothetical protein
MWAPDDFGRLAALSQLVISWFRLIRKRAQVAHPSSGGERHPSEVRVSSGPTIDSGQRLKGAS